MGARVVDWARLESVCTARYRGFESLPIRQPKIVLDVTRRGSSELAEVLALPS